MILEILFPLFFMKAQNVVQTCEFLLNSEAHFPAYFQRIQTNGNQEKKRKGKETSGNVLLVYDDKREREIYFHSVSCVCLTTSFFLRFKTLPLPPDVKLI